MKPKNWCPLRESDPRPLPYQGSALPLSQMGKIEPKNYQTNLERETGIEPVSLAWKAKVLPLNYSRSSTAKVLPAKCDLQHSQLVDGAGFEPA